MRLLLPVLLIAGLGLAQIFGPAGVPKEWDFGITNFKADTLEATVFTTAAATSDLSMSGDTLTFALTGASGVRDIVLNFENEGGIKKTLTYLDAAGYFNFSVGLGIASFVQAGTEVAAGGGKIRMGQIGGDYGLYSTNANTVLPIDPNSSGSGTLQLGETGDNDITWLNSLGRLEGSVVSSTYTAGATEEIWIEQSANATVNLPASPTAGDWFKVKFTHASGGTLDGNGKNIDGSATVAASENDAIEVIYNGTEWSIY